MVCEALNFSISEISIENFTRLIMWLIISTKIFEKQCHNRHDLTINPALTSLRGVVRRPGGWRSVKLVPIRNVLERANEGNDATGTLKSDTNERKWAETEKQTKRKQGHLITSFLVLTATATANATANATALSICVRKSRFSRYSAVQDKKRKLSPDLE